VEAVEELTFKDFAPLLTVVVSLAIVQFTLDFPHTPSTANPPMVVLSIVAVPSNPPFNPRKDLVCAQLACIVRSKTKTAKNPLKFNLLFELTLFLKNSPSNTLKVNVFLGNEVSLFVSLQNCVSNVFFIVFIFVSKY
jgi:hypothetical protein